MLRTILAATLLAAVAAAPARAAERTLLMPGVTYEREVEFTSHGPVALHVLTAPRPRGLWSLRPVLSNGVVAGRDRVTAMQRALSREATVAGVNGDFGLPDGRPAGILIQGGALVSAPARERSSLGIDADGSLRIERVRLVATWRGTGQRRPLALNEPPVRNGVALFTPAWGPQTPPQENPVEVVLSSFPPAVPNSELTATVTEVRQGSAGGTAIPPSGAVVAANATGAQRLLAEAPVGTTLSVRLLLNPDWNGVADALGGGPALVRGGKPVFRHFELFSTEVLGRNPRTAVGQLADGRVLLVAVDGRQPGYSVGMTSFELAQALVRLGAVAASGLEVGASTTMAFDGTLLNRPSDGGRERAVSEGLFVLYSGVYAAPPAEPVVSPNGDGVADAQAFSYKLVRPARVTVRLVGPDRAARVLETGEKEPGVQRFAWNAAGADGAEEPEGDWRLVVTAVDDLGRTSSAERVFSVNRTLAALQVAPALLLVGPTGARLRATFTLARPARVTATVETATGATVALAARRMLPAGRQTLEWGARLGAGAPLHSGRYVLRVAADNEIGRVELVAPFAARRIAAR